MCLRMVNSKSHSSTGVILSSLRPTWHLSVWTPGFGATYLRTCPRGEVDCWRDEVFAEEAIIRYRLRRVTWPVLANGTTEYHVSHQEALIRSRTDPHRANRARCQTQRIMRAHLPGKGWVTSIFLPRPRPVIVLCKVRTTWACSPRSSPLPQALDHREWVLLLLSTGAQVSTKP